MDELHAEIKKMAEDTKDADAPEESIDDHYADKAEAAPEPIDEAKFQKAMGLLEEEFAIDSVVAIKPELRKATEQDVTGFLKSLVDSVDESNKEFARGVNIRLSALGVVLRKAIEKLDALEEGYGANSRAPVHEPKGRRAPVRPLNKSFTVGQSGVNGDGRGPDDLTRQELKHGFNVLMDRAVSDLKKSGDESELERIGIEAGRFESNNGMISKAMRDEIFREVFAT